MSELKIIPVTIERYNELVDNGEIDETAFYKIVDEEKKKMTNLTEQWNKDKLKDGFYYVAIDEPFMPKKVEIIEFYKTGFETDMDSNYMHEVLAEVPSYEEYQKLLSDQLAKNEGAEINAELEERLKKTQKLELDLRRENRKLKTENKWYSEQLNEAVKEIAKLKKLLKKHRDIFARTLALCIDLNFSEKQKNQFADDIAEIDQVLGEE